MQAPEIDKSDFQQILNQMKALVPFYTPEWDATDEDDAGVTLLKLFGQMQETVISRLNRAPDMNFIAFLDMLGVKRIPARSARVPVTFILSTGNKENVLIPARTQSAAGEVVFETEKNILATPASLAAACSVNPDRDAVFDSPANFISGKMSDFFAKIAYPVSGDSTELFLDDASGLETGDIIKVNDEQYSKVIVISGNKINITEISGNYSADTPVNKVNTFELFAGVSTQEHILYLSHKDLFNIKPAEGPPSKITLTFDVRRRGDIALSYAWSYWGEDNITKKQKWIPESLDSRTFNENQSKTLEIDREIKETEVNGIKSRWIRCRVITPLKKNTILPLLDGISIELLNIMDPDMAFFNDVPLDLTQLGSQKGILPFGKQPRTNDVFYLSSAEAFSKKSANITIQFTIDFNTKDPPYLRVPLFSWEYWNGNGWEVIHGLKDQTNCFTVSGATVEFTCPADIQATKVNGQENFWIRAKIISGDYGKKVDPEGEDLILDVRWMVKGTICYPTLRDINITYTASQEMEHCLAYNNLEFIDYTEECREQNKVFSPFSRLPDDNQTLYLGFEGKPESGPISLFFSLEEAKYVEEKMPKVRWEYFSGDAQSGKWNRLQVLDETKNLTQTGVLEFAAPRDISAISKFSKKLYWIRAVDIDNIFESPVQPVPQIVAGVPASGAETIEPCTAEYLKEFESVWVSAGEHPLAPNPEITGIYLNTTWAEQAETITDEILGSSEGNADQSYNLVRGSVISADIWVNEINKLSEADMNTMLNQESPIVRTKKDEKGNTTQFWVQWQVVDDFLGSDKDSRVCEVDVVSGTVKFGDGVFGAIPPTGTDNIKADYRIGGGKAGNVEKATVSTLKTSIPFVDKVLNPIGGAGGSSTELISNVISRGPQVVKLRGRGVGGEDFEWLAKEASNAVARVKCLPNFNDQGEHQGGWITVIIVPRSEKIPPIPSLELISQVEKYIKARTANTVVDPGRLQICGPVYIKVSVEATINTVSIDDIPLVEKEAYSRLNTFLDPLTGGYEGNGWDFGRSPYLSDFYAILEKIPGVDYVKDLTVHLKAGEGPSAPEFILTTGYSFVTGLPAYTLVYGSEHSINATYEKENK